MEYSSANSSPSRHLLTYFHCLYRNSAISNPLLVILNQMMISGFARTRRPTDLLDDEARARIVGQDRTRTGSDLLLVSSGSEHSAQADDVSDPFFGFGEDEDKDEAGESKAEIGGSDCEHDDPLICESKCANFGLVEQILLDERDAFRKAVTGHVLRAVEVFSCLRSDRQIMRRNVMAYLRNCGYNAAVCKTKWRSSGGLSAGSYEFIDVLQTKNSARYFVDLDFAGEFEIARPTESYDLLIRLLPRIFVGTAEDLKQILKVSSDSARRSLKSRGLHLSPWRKHRFMQNKWLGPHRRTTNHFPASFSVPQTAQRSYGCKSRVVGFSAAVNGGRLLFPAAAQTK